MRFSPRLASVIGFALALFPLLPGSNRAAAAEVPAPEPPVDVWLDVDVASGIWDVDDGLMMIQAFHAEAVRVRGVSVVFGNTTLERARRIGEHVVERFGPAEDAPAVHPGAASAAELGKETRAVEAMAAALREEPMTIVAVGPVTNVGTLVTRYPELRDRIERIVVVAGRRPGQRFTVSEKQEAPFRDANFEKDVPAMAAILAADVPLVLAPWEVSSEVWLREADRTELRRSGGAGAWIAATARYWAEVWRKRFAVDGFTPFDTLAVGYLTHPELIRGEAVSVSIGMGPDDGAAPVPPREAGDLKPYLRVEPAGSDAESRALYLHTPKEGFKEALVGQLAGRPGDRFVAGGQKGSRFDHGLLDLVMRVFVNDAGRVHYDKLLERTETLDAYLEQLAEARLGELAPDERLALLINAYNAFTLKLIAEHPDVGSIKNIPASERWKAKRWNLGGTRVSLNEIEHEMIRGAFDEPRIHWALVCAARDCPPLRQEAYSGDELDAQLAEQARRVHGDGRHVRFDRANGVLQVTRLYDWYGGDFGEGDRAAVIRRAVARYHDGLREALEAGEEPRVRFLDYDWSLNAARAR